MIRIIVVLVILVAAAAAVPAPVLHARASSRDLTPRLRTIDPGMHELVRTGLELSPSLRQLAAHLERTDVVVYLKCARLPQRVDGQLTFLSAAAGCATSLSK